MSGHTRPHLRALTSLPIGVASLGLLACAVLTSGTGAGASAPGAAARNAANLNAAAPFVTGGTNTPTTTAPTTTAPTPQRVSRDAKRSAPVVRSRDREGGSIALYRLLPAEKMFTLPVKGGQYTSCYCERWGTFHDGIDLAAPLGTPIHAAGAGTVIFAGPKDGYGMAIEIRHEDGSVSFYGHMYAVWVQVGQTVTTGQEIAPVGSEGFSTGPHLHFGINPTSTTTSTVDPAAWLESHGVTLPPFTGN